MPATAPHRLPWRRVLRRFGGKAAATSGPPPGGAPGQPAGSCAAAGAAPGLQGRARRWGRTAESEQRPQTEGPTQAAAQACSDEPARQGAATAKGPASPENAGRSPPRRGVPLAATAADNDTKPGSWEARPSRASAGQTGQQAVCWQAQKVATGPPAHFSLFHQRSARRNARPTAPLQRAPRQLPLACVQKVKQQAGAWRGQRRQVSQQRVSVRVRQVGQQALCDDAAAAGGVKACSGQSRDEVQRARQQVDCAVGGWAAKKSDCWYGQLLQCTAQ